MKSIIKLTIFLSILMGLVTANVRAELVACGNPGTASCGLLSTDSANFTLLDPNGYVAAGANNVHMTWDGSAFNYSGDYTGPGSISNVTMSTTSLLFTKSWLMHDIQMFMPGSYSFNVTLGGGNPETGFLNVTVPTGHFGMHMLLDWNYNLNMDSFVVFAPNNVFGSGISSSANPECNWDEALIQNCLYTGRSYGGMGQPAGNQVWGLTSVDGNGDGVMGISMPLDGPFQVFNFNFNAFAPVPVPASLWLFGSGLIGLFGAMRRKKWCNKND